MRHVRLTVEATDPHETHPLYDGIQEKTFADNAIGLQWNLGGDGLGVLNFVHGDAEAFVEEVEDIPDVMGWDHAEVSDNAFFVYVLDSGTEPPDELPDAFTADDYVVIPPTSFHDDGTVSFSLFGPADAIQSALDRTPDPIDVDDGPASGVDALPAAVREGFDDDEDAAVEAAVETGYYDAPRTGTLAEVAGELGCSDSTAKELLGSAEATLITFMFN